MNLKVNRRAFLCAGLALTLAGGCGGGSGTAPAGGAGNVADATRGSLSLTLTFQPVTRAAKRPGHTREFTGFIPIGTQSVLISVTDPATGSIVAPAQLVIAPLSRPGPIPTTVSVSFNALPPGSISVQATAFPDTAGKQTPLAGGSKTAQITSGATTNVQIPFTLTLAQLLTQPTRVLVDPLVTAQAHTATVSATVADGSGRALLLPIYWLSQDPGIAQVSFDPASPTTATITGLAPGTTVVTLVEPNSGMTANVNVISGEE